ncbi:hypothetical protein AYO20_08872 [Fonsecaea nubica]|uniref:Aminoglycoside phosphotransferase domain-containing protein n=1 Tax=Fonsecaea nubica TaxID=856822 RepID=A0A178CLE3_9EURO|nr:hypothetical protein AYO20_08872 [Fonsecaea nubica]OAL30156.1 hypothetical protein AYO20_08872 [Fonsecaea nubica]
MEAKDIGDPLRIIRSLEENQHAASEILTINNTVFRRWMTLVAVKTTAKLYTRIGCCFRITPNKIVKTGLTVHLTEGATAAFVAQNTSVPVPKIYCCFLHKNRAYIVMERIQGDNLARVWSMSCKKPGFEQFRRKILDQLKGVIQELRSLQPPPGTGVESYAGG